VEDSSPVIQGGQTFIPLSQPCRLVDTRDTFGGTPLRLQTQTFSLTGKCQLPAADSPSAPTAYSLNVTVVPKTTLGYLSIWPAGQEQPLVSTLNSLDGRVKANAAIIPAGVNGAVSVFVTDDTEVILDLTGYFANSGGLDFVPVTPCRVVDTRNPNGPYGGPIFEPVTSRVFTIAESNCVSGLPNVYSLNATVVPSGPLGYLTLSNPNIGRPTVSTLNAVTGAITANAALISGSTSFGAGRLAAFVTERTHLLLDINGIFQSGGGLKYYPIQPCRLVDTRNPTGPYGGPALARTTERVFDVPAGGCGIPANARSYAVNATVVPTGPFGFLTMWGTGSARPTVSTLNALDGAITSNAAIVSDSGSTALRGRISVYASDAVHLILDVNGYFAP
jgi:hypothetical protein